MSKRLIIAIDGPSGAGKGTVARAIAGSLDYQHVDSGAMYRAVAWKALQLGLPLDDEERVAALAARAALTALLEAYLGRRSAARVQAGALRRGTGETIRAALLYGDLRGFTALSEATEPAAMIAALDAWFERVAGAVQAFGGEVLKFIGDGVLAIFPVTGTPAEACEAALPSHNYVWPVNAFVLVLLGVIVEFFARMALKIFRDRGPPARS